MTLKVLAGTLVLTLVASAFPLAEVALYAATDDEGVDAGTGTDGEGSPSNGLPPLPFLPPEDGSGEPSGASGTAGAVDGSSSRPGSSFASQGRASASGSVLLSQVLGAARAAGYDVELPPLPTDRIATGGAPLRAAILAWIASTGAVVPPDELATQLARADALPLATQRDIALLLLSATQASEMQRAALARIPASELEWIYAHPEVAEQLAKGIDTPDTRRMALLGGLVDMPQSIAATLLVLQAVEATRGSLSDPALAPESPLTATVDETTRAVLELLLQADQASSDVEKVRLAAKLVALGGGIAVPTARAPPTFEAALQRLLAATSQQPTATDLASVLGRAQALPDDLELAIARLLEAEAMAIEAASPAGLTPTSQHEALAATLVATAEALPVLEKYHLYWRDAPDALRLAQWDDAARAGWATHHIALLVSSRSDLVDLVQAAELVNGRDLVRVPALPSYTFVEAYEAVALAGGYPVTAEHRAEILEAADALAPALRDAATTLMTGAAESARLRQEAFADLSFEEQRFLMLEVDGVDALYEAPTLTKEQIATLTRASELAARVDAAKLAQSNAVSAAAMAQAKRTLEAGNVLATQAEDAVLVPTGLKAFLQRLLPFTTVRAQVAPSCTIISGIVELQCGGQDVLLRISYPDFVQFGYTPGETLAQSNLGLAVPSAPATPGPGQPLQPGFIQINPFESLPGTGNIVCSGAGCIFFTDYSCNQRECVVYGFGSNDDGEMLQGLGQANRDLLVITGQESRTYVPEYTTRIMCVANDMQMPTFPCRQENVARYGAPTISIDLGGDDTYVEARAMVHINATIPVSYHLDMGGNDAYVDPSSLYDSYSPLLSALGERAGHPTQGSAIFGGAAILMDVVGSDTYGAPTRSQGFGRLGVGMLVDLDGEDLLDGGQLTQGVASDTFTLGAGIVLNLNGNDQYIAESGQGYGLGGLFLDVAGADRYTNDDDAQGIPIARLEVLPGGDVTAFDRRDDDVAWIDGAGSLNVGIGVDQEIVLTSAGQSDGDGIPDLVEFAFGTDPQDSSDSPLTNPTARATALLDDTDGDGYPSYIERALSTDENDAKSYPAGLPLGIPLYVPAPVMDVLRGAPLEPAGALEIRDNGSVETANGLGSPVDGFAGGDKILDLRLPLQDAGVIEYACTGTIYVNQTAPPGAQSPNQNFFEAFDNVQNTEVTGSRNPDTNGPATRPNGEQHQACVYASYQNSAPGEGNATIPASASDGHDFTFKLPTGILAIGDVVNTSYALDYFLVIDLGGNDTFRNSAGGALPVSLRPRPEQGESAGNMSVVNQHFLAPSVVLNVDLQTATAGAVHSGLGHDTYTNASRDFIHGAFFGLLLDLTGNDTYAARDGSQGALGGVLLDLDGSDTYSAGNLSQGAAMGSQVPQSTSNPIRDLPGNDNVDHVHSPTASGPGTQPASQGGNLTARRALPGLLLDAGGDSRGNAFIARSHSQGFGRGFAPGFESAYRQTNASPPALGILASLGGLGSATPAATSLRTNADLFSANGRYSQGVGGFDGVGLLLDGAGGDTYSATGLISQGATIPMAIATQTGAPTTEPHPAGGIVLDLGGAFDRYTYKSATGTQARHERNDNVTISRGESPTPSSNTTHLYTAPGVHVDWRTDSADPERILASIGGAGSGDAISTEDGTDYVVNLPTARLAIGGKGATSYAREYAFVVDLGGDNAYRMNAGGFITDAVASHDADGTGNAAAPNAIGNYTAPMRMFPVSLLVDAGLGTSTYQAERAFQVGAGYFGIGLAIDLGGRDTFAALPEPLTRDNLSWAEAAPIIDGTIAADWDGIDDDVVTLVAQADSRIDSRWTMRVANDNETLYLALNGTTTSALTDRFKDSLTVSFDMGRQNVPYNRTLDRTGIDLVTFVFEADGKCVAKDRGFRSTSNVSFFEDAISNEHWDNASATPRLRAACRSTETGEVIFEISKSLGASPPEKDDLSYCYVERVGFALSDCRTRANEIGIYLEFAEVGSGTTAAPAKYSWPAGAVFADGVNGHARDLTLADEMSHWGAFGLAEEGADGKLPVATKPRSLTQGAAVGGVGILAMLGNTGTADLLAGDRSLGYGTLQGLGMLVDAGGSDRYVGGQWVLGAAETLGLGIAVDLNGNDNYHSTDLSLGYAHPAQGTAGGALFLDMGGDDLYDSWTPRTRATQKVDQLRGAQGASNPDLIAMREGNNVAWQQNNGVGLDYRIVSLVSETLSDTVANVLYGQTRTTIRFQAVNTSGPTPFCETDNAETAVDETALPMLRGKPVVSDQVCVVTEVQLGGGSLGGTSLFDTVAGLAEGNAEAQDLIKNGRALLEGNGIYGEIDVQNIDIFVDRARALTTTAIESDGTLRIARTVVDLSSALDGAARIRAAPLFTARMPTGEVLLFQDGNTDNWKLVDGADHKTLFVNNAPEIGLELGPEFLDAAAAAVFSPHASGAERALTSIVAVSPDALESELALANGLEPHPANTSVPCAGIPSAATRPQLCNILPLYLPNDGGTLTTNPGAFPAGDPAHTKVEFLDGAEYSARTVALGDSLSIMLNESFHLYLADRQGFVPTSAYRTEISVIVKDASNAEVPDQNGDPYRLAYEILTAPPGTPTNVQLQNLPNVFALPQEQVDRLERENVVWTQVNSTYLSLCATPQGAGCSFATGHYNASTVGGLGGIAFCKSRDTVNTDFKMLWDLVATADEAVASNVGSQLPGAFQGTSACSGATDIANDTAATLGPLSGVAAIANDTIGLATGEVQGAICTVGLCPVPEDADPLHVRHFYLNVNRSTYPAAAFNGTAIRFDEEKGSVTLAPGYKLELRFRLRTADGITLQPGDNITGLFAQIYAALDDQFGDLPEDVQQHPTFRSLRNNNVNGTFREQQGSGGLGQSVDDRLKGSGIPAGMFTFLSGDAQSQSRLEVRVPTKSTTELDVSLIDAETGQHVAWVAEDLPVIGDRPSAIGPNEGSGDSWKQLNGRQHTNWTVDAGELPTCSAADALKATSCKRRWTQYNITYGSAAVADGIYNLTVNATDLTGYNSTRVERVLIDSTPPQTTIGTPGNAGNALLGGRTAIPVQWFTEDYTLRMDPATGEETRVQGSGVAKVYLFVRSGADGDVEDISTWDDRGLVPFVGENAVPHSLKPGISDYYFLTVGVDRAGNVESVQLGDDGKLVPIVRATELEAVLEAARQKLARGEDVEGGYRKVFVDRSDPRFFDADILGGRKLNYQGSEITFLRSGQQVRFEICAADGESNIGSVETELFPIDVRFQSLVFAAPATPVGGCSGGTLYAYTGWHTVNGNASKFPEGIWRVQFRVLDNAGNAIRVGVGSVILDHASPTVTVDEPMLPAGQTAVKPGDSVRIRLLASDAWGVDESGITVDASAFNKSGGALATRPVRVNGIIYREANFTVDKPDIQNAVYEITVKVPDLAGNQTIVKKSLAVNFRPFEFVPGSFRVTNVTHNSLELRWRTDDNTTSFVRFGTTNGALAEKTTQTTEPTKEHVVKVEGLKPRTHYYLQAVSVSTGGFQKVAPELLEVDTTSALVLSPIGPVAGDAVSGLVPVRFRGGVLDGNSFVTYTLEVRDDASKPWTFVTTATRQGEQHTLTWNSTRYLDGKTYELRLTAEVGGDQRNVTIGPLTADNTPPSVLVITPLLATNDTTPALSAEAGDSLAGFDLADLPANASAQLLVDGKPYNGSLDVTFADERLRIRSAALVGIEPGLRTFELQIKDAAGNVAKETWKVAIDGEAPQVTVNPTRFAPGTAAARNAGTVTLNLTLRDLSGVATVVADTSELSATLETKLVKLVGTDNWQGTFTVNDARPAALHEIRVVAIDLAGNVNRSTVVTVPVDNVEPGILQTRTWNVTHTHAEIEVPADEAILVSGTATSPGSPPVTAATVVAAKEPRLSFDGLLPSRTYRFSLTATDLAGNPVGLAGSFETLKDTQAPTDVGRLSLVDLLNGTLRITWAAAEDDVGIAGYRVYRSEDGGVTFQLVAEVLGTSYDDRGLPFEKAYVYRVAAIDHGGNEGASTDKLRAVATARPLLSGGSATPTVGSTSTLFRYTVTYFSPGGRAPEYVRVILDGVPQNMTLVSGDPVVTGLVYAFETRLAPHTRDAPHTYAFEASDGRYAAKFPEDGSVLRGPLVSGDALSDEEVGRLAAFAQRVPLGGVAGVAIAMIAAVGIAAVLRRKKEGSK